MATEASEPREGPPLRELRVLEALVCAPPGAGLSLRECVELTGIPRASCHRVLRTLCEAGYAEHVHRGRYTPGWRLHLFGRNVTARADLLPLARPLLEGLAAMGFSAHLGYLDDDEVVFLDVADGATGLQIHHRPGSRIPAAVCSIGWAIAAYVPTVDVPRWAAGLRRELAVVRQRGYALDEGRYLPDLYCVAAPIRDRRWGRVSAALGLSGTAATVQAGLPQLADAVLESAARVSAQLWRR